MLFCFLLNFSDVLLVVFLCISDIVWTSCYLVPFPYPMIVCGRPSVSFVGDILLYIFYTVAMLCFWFFLTAFTSVFCSSSDSLPIYIASLY